jgi:hypothetical protein
MPRVNQRCDPLSLSGAVVAWLWAIAALAAALPLVAIGQALGAMVGGCRWIGASVPLGRPVWALVDQPTLDFASRAIAFGYWHGGWIVSAIVALVTIALVPRARTVAAELAAVEVAWAAATVGIAWSPFLDPTGGHPGGWIRLHGMPEWSLVILPLVAALASSQAVLRLLSLARAARAHMGRGRRLLVVAGLLVLPTCAFVAIGWWSAPTPPIASIAAVAVPCTIALAIAWIGYPSAYAWPLEPATMGTVVRALVAATAAVAFVWVAGRPLSDDRASAILWLTPSAVNNIRPWVEPTTIAGASTTPTAIDLMQTGGAGAPSPTHEKE